MWPDNRKVGWRWEREQRLTSIHESSHAVVAHLVGSRASIRLTVALDDRGRTSFGGLVTTATPRRRERSSPFLPRDRLLPKAEAILRHACNRHPGVSHRIARTEPEALDNVSLGFLGATDKNLS
jgi:hypothetical protein